MSDHVNGTQPAPDTCGNSAAPAEAEDKLSPRISGSSTKMSNKPVSQISTNSVMPDDCKTPMSITAMLVVFLAVALPAAALVVCFSAIGFGVDVYNAVAPSNMNLAGNGCSFLAGLVLSAVYVFDYNQRDILLRLVSGLLVVASVIGAAVLKGMWYPWAGILVTLLITYAILGDMRTHSCRDVSRTSFYGAVGANTGLCALILLLVWLGWISQGNEWNQETKLKLINATHAIYDNIWDEELDYSVHCASGVDLEQDEGYLPSMVEEIEKACSKAATVWFIVWMAPFIGVTVNAVVSAFCWMVWSLGPTDRSRLEKSLKKYLLLLTALITGMYCSVYASGALVQLGSAFMAFCAAASVALMVWLYLEVPTQVIDEMRKSSKLNEYLIKAYKADFMRAIAIIVLNAWIPFFFLLDFLRQRVRRCMPSSRSQDTSNGWHTHQGQKLWDELKSWDWVSISGWVCALCELAFVLNFGMKITFVFFSWLNGQLAAVDYGIVLVLVCIVGLIMFLLPPVPGSAVYMFAGIVIGKKSGDLPIGFLGGTFLATVLALITKLAACCGQYYIGYLLGGSVKVQQLIGVDKVPTRALEKILQQKGLKPGKVAILVGGPDWPTSVTCGILKLNIPQMLLGTLPVYIVSIAPQTLMGAMLTKETSGESGVWTMVAALATGISGVGQMLAMLTCVYFTTKVIERDHKELAQPRPEHRAVEELTAQEKAYVDKYKELTYPSSRLGDSETGRPLFVYMIAASVALQLIGFFIFAADFVLMEKLVFRKFTMTASIDWTYEKGGLNGSVGNLIIKGVGHAALGIFAVATVLHICWSKAIARYAHDRLAQDPKPTDRDNSTTGPDNSINNTRSI